MMSKKILMIGMGILVLAGGAISGVTGETLRLKENLRIGYDEKSQESVFAGIRSIQVDDFGRIYVLDDREVLVKVFDLSGRFLRSFGRRGQGPGDLQGPIGLILSGDVLSIINFGNQRISRFDLSGILREEADLRAAGNLFRAETEASGVVFGNVLDFLDDGSQVLRLVRFGLADHSLQTIAESRIKQAFPEINPMPDSYYMRSLPDGCFVWIYTGEYALNILSADGTRKSRKVRELQPVKVTENDKEMLIRENYCRGRKEVHQKGRRRCHTEKARTGVRPAFIFSRRVIGLLFD